MRQALWNLLGRRLFRATFHNWYGLRRRLLRAFGAKIAPTARLRPSAVVTHPWAVSIGAYTAVGDGAILAGPGRIHIGSRSTVSQYSHLCTRDLVAETDPPAEARGDIVIGDDCWIATDVYVAPGASIGDDTVVGARSTVRRSLPPRSICAGDDAKRVGPRVCKQPSFTGFRGAPS